MVEKILEIQSEDHLESMLRTNGVPLDEWDSFKGISDLWKEIKSGETQMVQEGKEVVRQVGVVRIHVFYEKGRVKLKLIEEKQVRNDGEERVRGFDYVAEKQKKGEDPNRAGARGVQEELGIFVNPRSLSSLGAKTEERDSPSYPGLKSRYKTYNFELHLEDSQFNPDGYVEEDEKKRTFFKWIPA